MVFFCVFLLFSHAFDLISILFHLFFLFIIVIFFFFLDQAPSGDDRSPENVQGGAGGKD
jgi:hypothetical protein